MVQIGGQDVVYSTSFTIAQNEEAVITTPELKDAVLRLRAEKWTGTNPPGLLDIKSKREGHTFTITFPFIDHDSLSFETSSIKVGRMPSASMRFTAQGGASLMTV